MSWRAISPGLAGRRSLPWSSRAPQQAGCRPVALADLRAALGGMQSGRQHRGQQGGIAAGPSSPDSLAAPGAEVLQQPLVDRAGEDDGQVPCLEPGAAERLLDGRPVAGEAFRAVSRCRGEDQPAVKAPGTSCLAFRGGDDGRVSPLPGAHAELGGLDAGEPGHPGEGAAARLRDPGQQDDGACASRWPRPGRARLALRSSRAAGSAGRRAAGGTRAAIRRGAGPGSWAAAGARASLVSQQFRRRGCPGRRIRCSAACAVSVPAGRVPGECRGSRPRRGRVRAGRRG